MSAVTSVFPTEFTSAVPKNTPVNKIAINNRSSGVNKMDPITTDTRRNVLKDDYKSINKRFTQMDQSEVFTVNRRADDQLSYNRFHCLISSSSSSESLNEMSNETIDEYPSNVRPFNRSAFERYNRDRINALDIPNFKHQTNYAMVPEAKFSKPGDSIFRNYWLYKILRDGTVSCVNAAGNRKKITQLVLRTRTAPYEFINGNPVTNYYAMFRKAERLQHISLSGLNLSNVRSLGRMFSDCFELRTVDMSGLNLSNVHDYQHMFDNCRSLRSVDFSGCNMTGAVKLDSMFYGCSSIMLITINGLNGSLVESMNHMFRSCESLRILELPNLLINDFVEMKKLFCGASKDIDIICPSSAIRLKYLKDQLDESSSSEHSEAASPLGAASSGLPSGSPSTEKLSEQLSDSDNEIIDEKHMTSNTNASIDEDRQANNSFPHVLTEEQRATAFKWAPPPQSIVPEFVDWTQGRRDD